MSCITADFTVIVPACSFGTILQTPSGTVALSQLTTLTISFTTSQAPSSACVGAVFSVGALPGFVTWNASSNILTASPTLAENLSQYTAQVNYGVAQATPFATVQSTIQVTVCQVSSLTTSDLIPDQLYLLGAQLKQTPTPRFIQTPLCNDLIDYSVSPMPTFIRVDSQNIGLSGNNISEAKGYSFVLTATANTSKVIKTVQFTVNAIDCTPKNFKALPNSLNVAQLGQVKNLIALSINLPPVECGQYTYSLLNHENYSFVTINDLTVEAKPTLTTAVSSYKVKAQVAMRSDPFLTSSLLINIAVTACEVREVIPDKVLPKTETFFVGGPEKFFELPKFTQNSACELALTLLYSDTAKNYTDSMVVYDLPKNKLIISATLPSQALSYKLTSTAKFQELPNVSNTQITDLKIVSAQCIKMKDANYAIKATAVAAKESWNLNDTGSLVTSQNFDYTQVKIEVSQQPAQDKLPSWFVWNATTRTFSIQSNKKEDAGSYKFSFLLTSTLHEGWKCQIDVTAILTVDSSASAIPNSNKIKFEKPITSSFDVKPGESWSYQLSKPTYLIVDKTVDVQNIKINVSAPAFIVFNFKALMLVSSREFTEKDENVKIGITLYDDLGQSTKESITITVKLPEPPAAATDEKEKKENAKDEVTSDPVPVAEETPDPDPVVEDPEEAAALASANAVLAQLKTVSSFEGWKLLMKNSQKQLNPDEPKPPVLPTPEISVGGVSSLGVLSVKFSSPMQVPDQFKKRSRILKRVEDALKVEMLGNLTDYTWNISDFTARQMDVQFYFNNASHVSINGNTDVLTLTILDPSFFKAANGYRPKRFMIAAELPKQIQLGSMDESVVVVADSASTASQGVVIGNLILSLMLSASLNQMWSMIEAQQIIVMFPMFFIGIPPVPAFFIAKFLEIANFDVLPVQNIWGKIFYMPPCYQLEARYNAVGMGDTQFVGNIGSLFVTIIIVQLMMIVAVITFQLKGCIKQERLKKGFKNIWLKLRHDAFWVVPIQTLMESSMAIVLSSLLVLQHPNWESTGQKVDTVIGYSMGILIVLFTIWSTVFMAYHRKNVTDELLNSFGPLWEDLNTDNHWIPFYRFAFLLRRIVLSAAIVLFDQVCFQLFAAYFQSLLMIITIGQIMPFSDKSRYTKEMINEVVILFSIYFVMCFSQLVPDDSAQNFVGYGFCFMLAVHIVINIAIIIITSVSDAIRKFRRWYFIREHMKAALLARLLIDRKKLRQNARDRIEKSRTGHEQALERDLEEISQLQQKTLQREKLEKKRLKNNAKLQKIKDQRLPTISEEEEEIIDTTSKKLKHEEQDEEIIETKFAKESIMKFNAISRISLDKSDFKDESSCLEFSNAISGEQVIVTELKQSVLFSAHLSSCTSKNLNPEEQEQGIIDTGSQKLQQQEEIIDTTSKKDTYYKEAEKIISTTQQKLEQNQEEENPELLISDTEDYVDTYQNGEPEKKSVFVDTWDEEEVDFNAQAFHQINKSSEALQSAQQFFKKNTIQQQVQSDSINKDFSADLIIDDMLDDEAGSNYPRSFNDQIVYPMNCSLEKPTMIQNPNSLQNFNLYNGFRESQIMERPKYNPQKQNQNNPKLKQSWGLQTLAALKFAGIADIRKRK